MTVKQFKTFCHWCVWPAVSGLLAVFAFYLFVIDNNSPVMDFGAKADFFLTLDGDNPASTIHLDDMPKVKIAKVTWLRACPESKSEEYLQVDGHSRHDVAVHQIAYPGELGPVVPKARWIAGPNETMRSMSFGQTGHAFFWMRVVSVCHWGWWSKNVTPIETPRYEFDIVP